MKILAIDTSSSNCSLTIVEINSNNDFSVIISQNNNNQSTHSVKLMPMIDDIFKKSNLTLNDIDILACGIGPGSFTGIRIGIATIKAFSDATGIPTIGVSSLESLAYNIEENSFIFPMIDCKNNNIYSALFTKSDYNYLQIGNNIAENISFVLDSFFCKFNQDFSTINFIGDANILHKELILNKFKNTNFNLKFSNNNLQNSISLAKCAYSKYLNHQFGDSNFISPLYLRKSQAERMQDEKQ